MQNMHMPSSCTGITAPHIQHFKTRQYIQRLPLLMLKERHSCICTSVKLFPLSGILIPQGFYQVLFGQLSAAIQHGCSN